MKPIRWPSPVLAALATGILVAVVCVLGSPSRVAGAAGAPARTQARPPAQAAGQVIGPNEQDTAVDNPALQALSWFYDQRLKGAPAVGYNAARARAAAQTRARAAAARAASPNTTPVWSNLGPNPLDASGGGSPASVSGRVESLAPDPTNPQTMYLGAADGGVWRTTDGGGTWTPLTDSITANGTAEGESMGALAVDPNNHAIIYAGTGEECFCIDGVNGEGLLKSTDSGATWSLVYPSTTLSWAKIVIDTSSAASCAGGYCGLFGATNLGLYHSADGGSTWTRVAGDGTVSAYDIALDTSTSPATVYTVLSNTFTNATPAAAGVYKSTADGAFGSFTQFTESLNGIPSGQDSPDSHVGRMSIAIDPRAHNTVYVAIGDPLNATFNALVKGVWRTTNGGASWTQMVASCNQSQTGSFCNQYQTWYTNTLAVDPTNGDLFYGDFDVWRSADGGATWTDTTANTNVHVDQHVLTFDSSNLLWVGNDGGVWRTGTDGASWSDLNQGGLVLTQFYPGASIAPYDNNLLLAGSQDNGTSYTDTSTQAGSQPWTEIAGGDGIYTAVDPRTPPSGGSGSWYVGFTLLDGLYRIDNPLSASPTVTDLLSGYPSVNTYGVAWVPPVMLEPGNPDHLLVGTQEVFIDRNARASGTHTWSAISQQFTNTGSISALAVANSMYAGTDQGQVFQGNDDSQITTWTDVTANLPYRAISSLTSDGKPNPNVYATLSGFGAYRVAMMNNTTNGWLDLSGNLPNVPVNVLRVVGSTLFVGTDVGVFSSTNGGSTWYPVGVGLPNSQVVDLVYQPNTNRLIAMTHGRGAWAATLGATPFTLTVSSSSCGSVNPSGTISHVSGDAISITATPNANCAFMQWAISGATCANGNNQSPCTFVMPNNNVSVGAMFQSVPTLTTSVASGGSGCGGTVSPNGTSTPPIGSAVSITATPNAGCGFNRWTISGATCTGGNSSSPCAFTMPSNNVTVSASFAVVPPAMTSPTPGTQLSGSTQTFTWSPGGSVSSYLLYISAVGPGKSDVYASSQLSGSTTAQTVNNLPSSGTLYVRLWYYGPSGWTALDYTYTAGSAPTLTVTSSGCGSTSPSGTSTPAVGSPVSISATPSGGCTFAGFTIAGASCGGSATTSPCTFAMPNNNVTVTATFAGSGGPQLAVNANGCGTTSPSGTSNPSAGAPISVSATPNGGCQFGGWVISGASCSNGVSTSPCTFTMPNGTVTVTANFSASSPCPPAMQSPSPGSTLSGSTQTFSWSACNSVSGYFLYVSAQGPGKTDVFASKQLSGSTTSQTVSNLPTSGTIYVRLWYYGSAGWTSLDYTYTGGNGVPTLNVTGNGCGSVTPSGVSTPAAGSSVSISATPNGGCQFTGWSISGANCVSGNGVSPCSFTMPNNNVSVSASFAVIGAPTLTVNTSGCGTVSPSGTSSPAVGSQVSITATPNANCSFSGWSVTGASCTAGNNSSPCVFTMPGSSVTVTASFASTNPCPPAMLSPTPTSTLASTTQTFTWSACNQVSGYYLYVSAQGAGKTDVFASKQLAGSVTSQNVSNLPASGAIYVRLWYYGSAGWTALDYTYTGGSSAPSPQSAAYGSSLANLLESAIRAVESIGPA